MKTFSVLMLVFLLPAQIFAQVVISEVMYDSQYSEGKGEHDWIEVTNLGPETIDLSTYKFYESDTNHGLKLEKGISTLIPGSVAIIASATSTFLIDWPNFNGNLFDSSFSLTSTISDKTLIIRNNGQDIDSMVYNSTMGAKDDGNSLQKIGNKWEPLPPTPGINNLSQTTTSTTTTSTTTSTTATTTENQNISENKSVSSNWPIEPQVFAKITTGPNIGIVGADILFKGLGLGVSKKPLANARHYWNFGDGSVKEGEAVTHAYNFIGEYIVSLDVSSGYFSGNDRLKIKIIPADLKIVFVKEGADGYVKIRNGNSEELDISYWQISSGNQNFILPRNTFILPKNELTFSYLTTGISALIGDTRLLYPNGQVANTFNVSSLQNSETTSQKNIIENQVSAVIEAVENDEKEAIYNSQKTTNLYDESDKKGSILPWIAGVAVLSILSSFAVVFGKKNEKKEETKPGDDFEIID